MIRRQALRVKMRELMAISLLGVASKDLNFGWVAKAAGQGYADKIELLVGLDSSAQALTGIFVLEQKETPGLGNKIVTNEWRSQFKGKGTARELVVVKGGAKAPHEIDSITGATISSKTVSDIVNATVNDLRSSLAAKATPGAS